MTDEEQRLIAAQLLEDLRAARKNLVCLEAKRDRYLDAVARGIEVLQGDVPGYYKHDKFLRGEESGLTIVKPETNIEWPDLSDVGELVNGINDATKKIERARGQLKRMGHDL